MDVGKKALQAFCHNLMPCGHCPNGETMMQCRLCCGTPRKGEYCCKASHGPIGPAVASSGRADSDSQKEEEEGKRRRREVEKVEKEEEGLEKEEEGLEKK